MNDSDLFALCLFREAGNQPPEGRRAVARVIYNRMAQGYFSDGTIADTIRRPWQFSWANGLDDAALGASLLQAQATSLWPDCQQAVIDGQIGSPYAWGPQGELLNAEPRALLYVNLDLAQPDWATADARICQIFAHTFFRG